MGDSAGATIQPAAVARPRRDVRRARRASGSTAAAGTSGLPAAAASLPPLTHCQVINHTPAGYALRQTDPAPSPLRIGELIALRVEGRAGPQVAMVRWFRNTLKGSAPRIRLRNPLRQSRSGAAAAPRARPKASKRMPVVVLPRNRRASRATNGRCRRSSSPAGVFGVDQGVSLTRGKETGFAVLTKLIEQGPGFEIYDFAPVS